MKEGDKECREEARNMDKHVEAYPCKDLQDGGSRDVPNRPGKRRVVRAY